MRTRDGNIGSIGGTGGARDRPRTRIGRIVTDPPTSSRLYLASGYFLLTGGIYLVVLLVSLASGALAEAAGTTGARAVAVGWVLGLALLHLAIGAAIARRARWAAVVAAVLLALPLLSLAAGGTATGTSMIFSLLGIAVIASIWKELR